MKLLLTTFINKLVKFEIGIDYFFKKYFFINYFKKCSIHVIYIHDSGLYSVLYSDP